MNESRRTVGEIVADDYRTASVFEKYNIDFCCGGRDDLATVCREKGIEPERLSRELEEVRREPRDRSQDYASWDLPFLADYIVTVHHSYLNDNIEQIATYSRKIAEVHGASHPEVVQIAALFTKVARDLAGHLREEEETFFPALKRAHAAKQAGSAPADEDALAMRTSLGAFLVEHDEVGEALHEIRKLSANFTIPENVCNTYMLTYQKLKEFEDDIHKHVHLENNILFPKAMELLPVS